MRRAPATPADMIRPIDTDRFIPTTGIHNLRDYGGYKGHDGAAIRGGLLLRSGQHVEANDADLATIDALDIRTVIDLRGTSERTRHPCRRSDDFAAEIIAHDGETSSSPPHMDIKPGMTTHDFARERMISVYKTMAANQAMISMFGRFFKALDQKDGASLVHCFAGKDRTGVAAMMLMHVLGASRDDQMGEYLLTNDAPTLDVLRSQSIPGMEQKLGQTLDESAVRAWLEVREDYLATYWQTVQETHGSLDAYLEKVIGVDAAMQERLRARFLI